MRAHPGLPGPLLGPLPHALPATCAEESACPFTLCQHLVGPRCSAHHAAPDPEQAREVPLVTAPALEVTVTPEISLHGCNLPSAWSMKARLREAP